MPRRTKTNSRPIDCSCNQPCRVFVCGCRQPCDPSFPYNLPEGFSLIPKPQRFTCYIKECQEVAQVKQDKSIAPYEEYYGSPRNHRLICQKHACNEINKACQVEGQKHTQSRQPREKSN